MSFSAATKNELARLVNRRSCCRLAELTAVLSLNASIRLDKSLRMRTENASVARKILSMLKGVADDIHTEVLVQKRTRLRRNNVYLVDIPSPAEVSKLLEKLQLTEEAGRLVSDSRVDLLKKECCRRAYLRGAFLGGGSVNNPEGAYHLELVTSGREQAAHIAKLMRKWRLPAKMSERKNWYVVYLKGSEQIVRFLNIIGAHSALLHFENTIIYKDVRNQVNRLVNCETSNLNKTVNASVRQLENIKLVQEEMGLENIAPSLREIAELRMKYPDACLNELGAFFQPRLSKSGVSYRLRKIDEIAEDIKNRKL